MNTLELLKQLISIPSYVDKKNNEKEIGEFIYRYLKESPFLTKIEKQKVEGERFNVIASDGTRPNLLLVAHMDTVEPRGWRKYNPFQGIIKGNRLYGLGSVDMKAGLAAILSAVKDFKKISGLMLLFYCDEEYNFKGMKKFVGEYKIAPQLVLSTEPTDLKIWNGARGIIKISFHVKGLTAPASRIDQGRNAILGAIGAVKYLERALKKYKTKNMGPSTCNLSAIYGGLEKKQNIDQKGDAVPDIAQILLDIRSGHPFLEAEVIKTTLDKFLLKNKFKLRDFIIYHDLSAFYTPLQEIKPIEHIVKDVINKADHLNPCQMGYQDIQIINKEFKVPAISIGPRGGQRHQPNEWVNIEDLDKIKKICQSVIRRYCFVL